ncbi:MAG: hypothetical protein WCT39_02045 [Candidatus Margulisiibacteriota bacterium]
MALGGDIGTTAAARGFEMPIAAPAEQPDVCSQGEMSTAIIERIEECSQILIELTNDVAQNPNLTNDYGFAGFNLYEGQETTSNGTMVGITQLTSALAQYLPQIATMANKYIQIQQAMSNSLK